MTDNVTGSISFEMSLVTAPVKVAIVIPTWTGNPETKRCRGYLAASASLVEMAEPGKYEFVYAVIEGEKMEAAWGPTPKEQDVPAFMRRDREIARCRWEGLHKAFDDEGADVVLMVDTDVVVPIDFFPMMLQYWPLAEAKTCHILGTNTVRCRHLDDHTRQLPEDTLSQDIAGEVIYLTRSLWERMRKDWKKEGRMNEDFEIAEFVREAGAKYWLVPVRCWAD